MNSRGREIGKAVGYFVLGALTMLLMFVFMVMWHGR